MRDHYVQSGYPHANSWEMSPANEITLSGKRRGAHSEALIALGLLALGGHQPPAQPHGRLKTRGNNQ